MRLGLLDRVRRLARLRVPRRLSRSADSGAASTDAVAPGNGAPGAAGPARRTGQQWRPGHAGSRGHAGSWAGLAGRHRRDAGPETARGDRSPSGVVGAGGVGPGEAGFRSPDLSSPDLSRPGPGGPGPGGPGPSGSGPSGPGPSGSGSGGSGPGVGAPAWPRRSGVSRVGSDMPGVRVGSARARVREMPQDERGIPLPRAVAATPSAVASSAASNTASSTAASRAAGASATFARAAPPAPRRPAWRAAPAALRARLPFTAPHARDRLATADGRRHCGSIETLIWRQWDTRIAPPAAVVAAIDRLAELPERIKARLADGLDAIFVGPGGVPELDDMTALRGVKLPSGRASWDACAGAYGDRKIVVGTQPSPTPDVMCHEIGHALDDIDSLPGKWQSDSAEFRMLYDQCQPHFASDFHRQPGGLGRKEFFADAFAAIASGQRPALVDMLGGQTRTALRVMLYFNRRYDI
jgi:hypothetical protein